MPTAREQWPELVLASGSPRRRQLLAELGLAFRVVVPDVDETPEPGEAPAALVGRLAAAKAASVAGRVPDAIVLGADTVAAIDGVVLGKPADAADARAMLGRLSGRRHQVLTGVAVATAGRVTVEIAVSTVTFAAMTEAEIAAYVAAEEPLDKAGAYAIQGKADRFATIVDGAYDNVVGLPLDVVRRLLGAAGLPTS